MSYFVVTHRALRGGPLSSVTNTATTITSPSYTTPRDSITAGPGICLNDHLAGATMGVELFARPRRRT